MKRNRLKNALKTATAGMLLAGMLLPGKALAASTDAPSAADTSTVSIYGVEEGATLNAYHIVEATYNEYGLTGYRQTDAAASVEVIDDLENPTYEDIAKLSQKIYSDKTYAATLEKVELQWDANKGCYVGTAEAGSYLVLVESESGGLVYNPMYVSNCYTDANDKTSLGGHAEDGTVTATEDVITLSDVKAYAKKSQTYFEKNIVDSSTGNSKVDDERVGDTVTFDLTTVTPDYSDALTPSDIVFRVNDAQSEGLAVVEEANVAVFIGDADTGTALDAANYTLTVDAANNAFEVDFDPAWVRSNPLVKLTIRYSTVIDDDAVYAANSNPNTAKLTYTTVYGETAEIKDKTRHYTFLVNFTKVNADGEALSGAEFLLTQISEDNVAGAGAVTGVAYEATSGADGTVSFAGLEEGTYLLRETSAPKGYALNDSEWEIQIAPVYDHVANLMDSYTVTITETLADGTKQTPQVITYRVESQQDAADELSDTVTISGGKKADDSIMEVVDLKLLRLPSVGGSGTLLYVGGAVLLSGFALVLVVATRKKKEAAE